MEVWLGQYDPTELVGVFAIQAAWAVALVLAGRRDMQRAVRLVFTKL